MNAPAKYSLKVYQGNTFTLSLRWESDELVYADISNITKTAPVEITTLAPHGLPDGWRARVYGVGGMKEINSDAYSVSKVISTTSISVNSINAKQFSTYTSGGTLEYKKPIDLAAYTARMQVRKNTSSEVLLEVSSASGEIVLDNILKTITITIPSSITSALTFSAGVYSLELTNTTNDSVYTMLDGIIRVIPEITR